MYFCIQKLNLQDAENVKDGVKQFGSSAVVTNVSGFIAGFAFRSHDSRQAFRRRECSLSRNLIGPKPKNYSVRIPLYELCVLCAFARKLKKEPNKSLHQTCFVRRWTRRSVTKIEPFSWFCGVGTPSWGLLPFSSQNNAASRAKNHIQQDDNAKGKSRAKGLFWINKESKEIPV